MIHETILKDILDKRICDIEGNTENTQTYREFIKESENEFGMEFADIDLMKEDELRNYLDFMDELWNK